MIANYNLFLQQNSEYGETKLDTGQQVLWKTNMGKKKKKLDAGPVEDFKIKFLKHLTRA